MPSTAETLWVAPADIGEVLPHVIGMLNDAVEHCGDWTLQGVCDAIRNDKALLWVTWDGTKIGAAAVSQLVEVPHGKVCQVIACGGSAISWPEAIVPIELYAKAIGCVLTRIWGRPGWSRVFKDYRLEWVALEKRLD